MKRHCLFLCLMLLFPAAGFYAQVPVAVGVQILKAEDARRYDDVLRNLLSSPKAKIRERAALAAGRIGDDKAVLDLVAMLADNSAEVRTMAVFAIGEVESVKSADPILSVLKDPKTPNEVRARAVEAAGKIAAANSKDEKAKTLDAAILDVLKAEDNSKSPDMNVVRLALTAALRARPAGAEEIVRKFLAFIDPDVVCDALNILARLRAKNANRDARDLLSTSVHAMVRANAARVLGAAEDKDAFGALLKAATTDVDSRVRVSAIRSLASLKDAKAADKLIESGKDLLRKYHASKLKPPSEQSELLEIATTLGRLMPGSNNQSAKAFLMELRDSGWNSEADIAYARVAPDSYVRNVFDSLRVKIYKKSQLNWREISNAAQALGELIRMNSGVEKKPYLATDIEILEVFVPGKDNHGTDYSKMKAQVLPDVLRAYAALKRADLGDVLITCLKDDDLFVRATAADILSNQLTSKKNVEALKKAFDKALARDKDYNDALLSTLEALNKLDKRGSVGTFLVALNAPDYLVRKRAFELLADKDLQKEFPGIQTSLENARAKHKDQVLHYSPGSGTKLGQVLNTDADYRRALSRKNGSVKAVLTTEKGTFTIVFNPEEAPLTVDNWVNLARSGYFNGLEVHRVVPNFVMQDGDPRGDGNGGPGWSIRCEVNMLPYDRGAVGMALSGKDTGGSQWFVTHSPQPHLDGGYTVFGHVNETDMKVVDNIVRGDKIISVKIIEGVSPRRTQRLSSGK